MTASGTRAGCTPSITRRRTPGELQAAEPEADQGDCCVPLRFEFFGQKIVAIFSPSKPDLVDLEFVKRILGTGKMIPVLMRTAVRPATAVPVPFPEWYRSSP